MKKLTIFVMAVALITGVAQALTADDVEAAIVNGAGYTATYLDLTADTRNGLTLSADANGGWGYPDGSDSGTTVNGTCLDDDNTIHDDFLVTISGLTANTDYVIAVSGMGGRPWATDDDFTWGTVADGSAINTVEGAWDQEGAVDVTPGSYPAYIVFPIGTFTSDANGDISLWLGAGTPPDGDHYRTQLDGVAVLVPSDVAFNPDPADGASNVSQDTDLRWLGPTDANDSWTYDIYLNDSYLTTVGGVDPNVPNSVIGTLPLGVYSWYVDSIGPGGSPVRPAVDTWTFTVGIGLPSLPSPEDGTGGYGLELTLQWTSDNSLGLIDHHKLVLNNVTDGTSVTVDNIPEANSTYDLGNQANPTWAIMQYGQTWEKQYTWQIIEVGAGGEILAEGPEWSFGIIAVQCTGFTVWGDFTGDCKANLDDIAWIALAWLDCGWTYNDGPVPYPDKDPCLW